MPTLNLLTRPWRTKLQRNMAVRAYRQRLWRIGSLFAVSLVLVSLLSSKTIQDRVLLAKDEVMGEIKERPEFLVHRFEIEGASPAFAQELQNHLELKMPMSRFELDLPALLAQTKTFLNVKDAVLNVEQNGVLVLNIAERQSAFVWKNEKGYFVLDPEGRVIGAVVSRKDFAHLPLLSGHGAEKAAIEAQALFTVAQEISQSVYGLRRVGERRWDVMLSQDRILMLPQEDAVDALRRFVFVQQNRDILKKNFAQVDMRLKNRIFVRWREGAQPTFASLN